ncbi:37S ribosomal protein Rsm22 [Cladophialophora carrionii]|uniref:37S ribosomal protein Rsm22 n=1 Tax=Cladophialophora carrionii TaxID=86049 RepID=A0A1C1CTW1_9EURO|nr:37S ribosomal protein Rsm22 [Cladophialophora carrionii]
MLSRARSSRLCHGCRQDLQAFFDKGFCGPPVALKNGTARLPLQWRRSVGPQHRQLRHLGGNAASFQQHTSSSHRSGQPQPDDEQIGANLDAEQLQVLQELETALGRPVEEAIEADRAASTSIQDLFPDSQLYQDEEVDDVLRGTNDPLATLRASGASHEDLVREARQVYGDGLPQNALDEEELKIYKRLYGEPRSLSFEEFLDEEEASAVEEAAPHQLMDQDGELVEYDASPAAIRENEAVEEEDISQKGTPRAAVGGVGLEPGVDENFSPFAPPDVRTQEIARMLNGQVIEEGDREEEDEADEEYDEEVDPSMREHPFTRLGKFATTPRSIFLSQDNFVEPVQRIMSNFSNKHLKEMCEKTFGGPGFPDSPLTPRSGRSRRQVPIPLGASQHLMGEMEANAYITTIMPPTYAAIMSVLVETRKRLGTTWLNKLLAKEGGPRILDAGAGGAGILAWREIVQAHWDSLHSSDKDPVPPPPPTKSVVLTGSDTLRHRAAKLLENTTFIPRLPDYVHTRDAPTLEDDRPAQQRKQFDVIIAPHTLFPLHEEYMRKNHVQNLWSMLSSEGGVLILIEKGIPRGFEAIGAARELLLERHIAIPEGATTEYSSLHNDPEDVHSRSTGMIVAPCTNHERCPMYKTPGLSKGRKDFCSFQQRYIRPSYLQRALGAKDRNHDDVDFSYISVMKGEDLRQRQVQSWSSLEDSLSAPVHPSPQVATEEYESWTELSAKGFEEVHPESNLTNIHALFADGDKPPSTLPSAHTLPRLVYAPMKRRGHVILDVCTPHGTIERWTVPRSFGRQAYRDARKSRWGDLWALGAKTRIPRNLRLGGLNTKEANKARGRNERLKQQAQDLLERMQEEKLDEMDEMQEMEREFREGRFLDEGERAKKSRPSKIKREQSNEGVEAFTMDDFDMNELNPPLISTKKQPQNQNQVPSHLGRQATRRTEPSMPSAEPAGKDDLTPEEMQTLREWDDILAGGSGLPVKGARSMRQYSKFAPKGRKSETRKSGKVR